MKDYAKTEQAVVKTMLDEIADEERRILAEKGDEYEKRLGIDKEQPTTTKTRRREYFKGLAKVNPRMYKKSQKDLKKIFEKALKKHKGDKTAARDEVLKYNEDWASTLHANRKTSCGSRTFNRGANDEICSGRGRQRYHGFNR